MAVVGLVLLRPLLAREQPVLMVLTRRGSRECPRGDTCDVPNWLGPRGAEPGTDGDGIPIGLEGSAEPGAERRGAPGDEVGGEVTEGGRTELPLPGIAPGIGCAMLGDASPSRLPSTEHAYIKEAKHPAREMVGHSFVLSATRPLTPCLPVY